MPSLLCLLSLVPAFEARYAIPVVLAFTKVHPATVFLVCTGLNLVVIPLLFLALDLAVPPLSSRFGVVKRVVGWFFRRKPPQALGLVGLWAFVSIPLPVTGAYTGTLLAYLLGMKRLRAGGAVAAGVITSSALTTLGALGVLSLAGML